MAIRLLSGTTLVALLVAGCSERTSDGAGDAATLDATHDAVGDAASDPYEALDPRPFGVHTACAPGPDGYGAAKGAGVVWTRGGCGPYAFWSLIDPDRSGDPTRMRFSGSAAGPGGGSVSFDYDADIGGASAAGLAIVLNISVEPTEGAYSKPNSWLPVDESAYARFVDTLVKRYPGVRVFQVGNEPNVGPEAGRKDFGPLYRVTYQAIKSANPNAVVVMGGVAGNTTKLDQNSTYFDAVLDSLIGQPIDVFDVHFYGDALGGKLAIGADPFLGYDDFESVAKFYRARLDARGFGATRMWSTENGTPSGTWNLGPGRFTTPEAEQARDLPKRWVVALASGVEKVFWAWGIAEGFGVWDDDFFDHTGLVYSGHDKPADTRKLGYWSYWQMTRQLEGCAFRTMERLETSVPQTRAYRCRRSGGGAIVIAWWDTFAAADYVEGKTVELAIPWEGASAKQRAAVPTGESGATITDPASAFPTSSLAPSGGKVTLTLGKDPVYVRAD